MVKAKTVDKKVSAAKKGVKKEFKKAIKRQSAKNFKQDSEIAKLRDELNKLKSKKVRRGHVSEYNFFVRKQIKSGLSFSQAAKQWNKYKTLQSKNKRRPSAYNQFIGSQMRLGKTFKQAVALWKLAKAGKLGNKSKTRTITKTVVRNIKSKPKIKYRTRTIVRKVKSKPVRRVVERIVNTSSKFDESAFKAILESTSVSKSDIKSAMEPDSEEIAFKLVQTYFIEVARLGFKRQLSLDEIINAYFYALARVKRQNVEMSEVELAVKRAMESK